MGLASLKLFNGFVGNQSKLTASRTERQGISRIERGKKRRSKEEKRREASVLNRKKGSGWVCALLSLHMQIKAQTRCYEKNEGGHLRSCGTSFCMGGRILMPDPKNTLLSQLFVHITIFTTFGSILMNMAMRNMTWKKDDKQKLQEQSFQHLA